MIHRGLRAGVPQLRCDVNEITTTRQERGSVCVPRIVQDVAGYLRLLHRQIEALPQSGIVERSSRWIREYQLYPAAFASIYLSSRRPLEHPQTHAVPQRRADIDTASQPGFCW